MIGHDDVIPYFGVGMYIVYGINTLVYYLSNHTWRKAGIIDSSENMAFFVRTYCDEIYALIIVVPLGSELMSVSHLTPSFNRCVSTNSSRLPRGCLVAFI